MLNTTKLAELGRKVKAEGLTPHLNADMAYLFGQTIYNQESPLAVANEFTGPIGLIGHDDTGASGFPGFTVWKNELLSRGITEKRVVGIMGSFNPDGNGVLKGNTLTEAFALVRFAKEHKMQAVTIVAPRWHLLRCLMNTVGATLKLYPELKLYPVYGAPLPWEEESVHSQGTLTGDRIDFVFEETLRLFAYHEQESISVESVRRIPDVPAAEDVLEYLDRRGG